MTRIRFGTDGWRGVIAEEFTEANAALVIQAIADTLRSEPEEGPVVVGYDTRFASDRFANLAAEILAGNGYRVLISERAVPTPVVAYAVKALRARAGVVITASHNPAKFNGIKLKAPFGGSAPESLTAKIEAAIGRNPIRRMAREEALRSGLVEPTDLVPSYVDAIKKLLDGNVKPPRPLHLIYDRLYGAGDGILNRLCPPEWARIETIHDKADPLFGGLQPEPIPPYLDDLVREVIARKAEIGLATDGDGDRLGAVTPSGRVLSPHQLFPLLLHHLYRNRGWRGEVVKGFAIGVQVDRLAAGLGCPLTVVPVGFKHIAQLMLTRDILIGGEESGGFGIKGYLPERDGLLAGLLLTELAVVEGKGVDRLLTELEAEVGCFVYRREDSALHPDEGRRLTAELDRRPPERLGGESVVKVENLDGRKFWLPSGAWCMIRPSGTEPVLRVYVEAPSEAGVEAIHADARRLVRTLLDGK